MLVITLEAIDLIPTLQLRVTLGCKKARKLGNELFLISLIHKQLRRQLPNDIKKYELLYKLSPKSKEAREK